MLTAPMWLPRVALGSGKTRKGEKPDILIIVFLRGGIDGLNMVSVYDDPFMTSKNYLTAAGEFFPDGLRPTPNGCGDFDGIGLDVPNPKDMDPYHVRWEHLGEVAGRTFGINKALLNRESAVYNRHETLFDLYQAGEVAFIPCAGSPDTNRSHFEAEALIEHGNPNQDINELTGWMTRYLENAMSQGSPLRAAAFTLNSLIPRMLGFSLNSMAMQEIADIMIPGNAATLAQREAILRERYEEQTSDPLRGSVLTAIETANLLSDVQVEPNKNATYTNSQFGIMCQNLAALVHADIDLEMAVMETGGHDTHAWEGPYLVDSQVYNNTGVIQTTGGTMYNNLRNLGQNLTALRLDLADHWDRVCLVVHSEFGRQINMNGTFGTDHANANVMTLMGGKVNGGIYCKESLGGPDGFPSLDPGNMDANHDPDGVRTTMDYRRILAEILRKCMRLDQATIDDVIFPTGGEDPQPVIPFDEANEIGLINDGPK